MSQQINLFNPLFLKQRKYFSFIAMSEGLIVLLLGLGLLYGYVISQRSELNRQAGDVERQHRIQKERFQKLSAELASEQDGKSLEGRMLSLQAEISAKEAILQQLNTGLGSGSAGYSEMLRAFSRRAVSGVWLTGIQLDVGTHQMTVKGRATQADLLPVYIHGLGEDRSLQGFAFERLHLVRMAVIGDSGQSQSGMLEFSLLAGDRPAARMPGDATSGAAGGGP